MYAGIYILCKYYGKGGGGEMVSWGKKFKRGKKRRKITLKRGKRPTKAYF